MGIGKEILRLRKSVKMSAQKFADTTGVDAERLRKWEQRDIAPAYEDRVLIEKTFGKTIEELISLKELPPVLIIPNKSPSKDIENCFDIVTELRKDKETLLYTIELQKKLLEQYEHKTVKKTG